MIDSCLAELGYFGHYVAIWKIAIFLVIFGLWAWVGQWLDKDTQAVHTKRAFWNNIYLATGAVGIGAWFVMPAPFMLVLPLLIVIWVTVTVVYILHRNARVPNEQRILTVEHIKSVCVLKGKTKETVHRFTFISANNNELPAPNHQDTEYPGYKVAEEIVYDMRLRRVTRGALLPAGDQALTRYTIDGVITNAGQRTRAEADAAIAYLKAVADLDIKDHRRPQSGPFSIEIEDEKSQWRVETAGSTRGEQMILERVEESETLVLEGLGLNAEQREQLDKAMAKPGIILVCGPASSGVTTTLYALIRNHDAFIQNINSLEMDSLVELDNVTQHILKLGTSPQEAARRLESVLRSDPDIVMTGFCNSAEMAVIGTKSARDGKKLSFGFAQPSTFHALQEWLKLVGKPDRVSKTLVAITCQRLLRKLCLECREAYTPDATLLKKLNLPAERIKEFFRPPREPEYDKHGNPILCNNCQGTGYFGRTAVFETLFVSDALRELIATNAPINTLRAQCRKERMLYLQEQALRKVMDGTTSIQEVLRVTADKPAAKKQQPTTKKEDDSKK